MNELREAAKKALIVLQCIDYDSFDTVVSGPDKYMCDDAYDELRAALAQPEPMLNGLTEEETNASASVSGLTRPKPEQEPVAWMYEGEPYFDGKEYKFSWCYTSSKSLAEFKSGTVKKPRALYTAPPQRKSSSQEAMTRKPLTEDEINKVCAIPHLTVSDFVRAIERAHGIMGEL